MASFGGWAHVSLWRFYGFEPESAFFPFYHRCNSTDFPSVNERYLFSFVHNKLIIFTKWALQFQPAKHHRCVLQQIRKSLSNFYGADIFYLWWKTFLVPAFAKLVPKQRSNKWTIIQRIQIRWQPIARAQREREREGERVREREWVRRRERRREKRERERENWLAEMFSLIPSLPTPPLLSRPKKHSQT